jgi:acyl carrier protein
LSPPINNRALVEKELGAIARSVMHTDFLKTKSSLFEQGLTSLGAMEILTLIEQRFQIELRSSTVFDYPTLAGLTTFTMEVLGEDSRQAEIAAPSAGSFGIEEALVRDLLKKQFGV